MAYEKDSGTSTIRFFYTRELLFNNASLRSSYKSLCLSDQQGNYMGEPYTLSDDERDAFDVCVDTVVADVYDMVLKMTSGVADAFVADSTQVAFKIRDNQGYNENALKNLDVGVKNALVNGILREWYDLCAKPDFRAEYAVKYQAAMNALRTPLFQLRKKLID